MSRYRILLASAALIAIIAAFFWWLNRPSEQTVQPRPAEVKALSSTHLVQSGAELSQSKQAEATPAPTVHANQSVRDEYPQPSLKAQARETAISAYIENIRRDPQYQWKIPIRFYGKVVDQNNEPVPGANVHFQWNDLSTRGTSEATKHSDSQGLFSLSDVRGKRLGVRVEKDGYYTVEGGAGMISFEYANPAESWFYEPDSNNPVIFHLRKKGESQPLVVKSVELKLSGQGATATVELTTGRVALSGGQLQVTVWKPTITTEQINTGKVFPYGWRIQVKINGGGLVEHKDAFAFEAPESGYVAEYDANLHPTSGMSPDVTVDKQFYFYFGERRQYGRMNVSTDGARPYVFIDYWLNPSGSRNLEYDPLKAVPNP